MIRRNRLSGVLGHSGRPFARSLAPVTPELMGKMFLSTRGFHTISTHCAEVAITVKPPYNAPAYNVILGIEHINFSPKKYFHSYLYVGYSENLDLKHNFD